MATNTTEIELVEFRADGLDALAAGAEKFAGELDAARTRAAELADKLNHPAYRRHLDAMAQTARQYKQLADQQEKMRKQAEWDAKSTWEKSAGVRAAAGRIAGAGVAAGFGLAAKGLSGSAEMALLDARIQSLAQSIAGMAVPAVTRLTSFVEGLDRVSRGLTGSQQSLIGSTATGAAIGYAIGGKKGGLIGGGLGLFDSLGAWVGDSVRQKYGWGGPGDRTDVTPFNPGTSGIGTAYEELFQKGQMLASQSPGEDQLTQFNRGLDRLLMILTGEFEKPGR